MTIDVRIGPGAVVCLVFRESELEKTLAPYLTWTAHLEGHEAPYYYVSVCDQPPTREKEPNELEASGDHFVFRFDPKKPREATAYLWGDLPGWQVACPLRQLFSWLVAHSGGVLLHASAIHMPGFGGAVVFAGPSGSGKSTLVGLMSNGADVLGDDWVIVRQLPAHLNSYWVVQSLYTSLKLSSEHVTFRRPDFAYNGKEIYRVRTTNHVVPVRALVLPHVAQEKKLIACAPASLFDAVKQTAPSTLLQSAGVPPETLGVIHRFAEAVPRYELTVGREWLPSMRDIMGALLRQGD